MAQKSDEVTFDSPAVLPVVSGCQFPPEDFLPLAPLSAFPFKEHVGSKHGVLVKGVGDFSRKLESFQSLPIPDQVVVQRGELLAFQ